MRLCEECSEETKDDKPFCSEHVERMAYVVALGPELAKHFRELGLCSDCGEPTNRGPFAQRCMRCVGKIKANRMRAYRSRPDWPERKRRYSRKWRATRSPVKAARIQTLCQGVCVDSGSGEAWAALMAARVLGCSVEEDRALQAAWAESVRSEARARLMSREGAA